MDLVRKTYNEFDGVIGAKRLYDLTRHTGVSYAEVRRYLDSIPERQTRWLPKVTFASRDPIITSYPRQLWSLDLIDAQKKTSDAAVARQGRRLPDMMMVVIDDFSKFVWVEGLKNKRRETLKDALTAILARAPGPPPNTIVIDGESGMEGIRMPPTSIILRPGLKSASAEAVIRILKNRLFAVKNEEKWPRGSFYSRWVPVMARIVDHWNATPHTVTKVAPSDVDALGKADPLVTIVRENIQDYIRRQVIRYEKGSSNRPIAYKKQRKPDEDTARSPKVVDDLKVGTLVRVYTRPVTRDPFAKGWHQRFSDTVFRITSVPSRMDADIEKVHVTIQSIDDPTDIRSVKASFLLVIPDSTIIRTIKAERGWSSSNDTTDNEGNRNSNDDSNTEKPKKVQRIPAKWLLGQHVVHKAVQKCRLRNRENEAAKYLVDQWKKQMGNWDSFQHKEPKRYVAAILACADNMENEARRFWPDDGPNPDTFLKILRQLCPNVDKPCKSGLRLRHDLDPFGYCMHLMDTQKKNTDTLRLFLTGQYCPTDPDTTFEFLKSKQCDDIRHAVAFN
jgi:hypothetical protein